MEAVEVATRVEAGVSRGGLGVSIGADVDLAHGEPTGCAPLVGVFGVSFDTDVLAADSRDRNAPSS